MPPRSPPSPAGTATPGRSTSTSTTRRRAGSADSAWARPSCSRSRRSRRASRSGTEVDLGAAAGEEPRAHGPVHLARRRPTRSVGRRGRDTTRATRGAAARSRCALDDGYAVMQALIERGVIGDFRAPDLMRFGFAPLYVSYADVWDAVAALELILATGVWREPRFATPRRGDLTRRRPTPAGTLGPACWTPCTCPAREEWSREADRADPARPTRARPTLLTPASETSGGSARRRRSCGRTPPTSPIPRRSSTRATCCSPPAPSSRHPSSRNAMTRPSSPTSTCAACATPASPPSASAPR